MLVAFSFLFLLSTGHAFFQVNRNSRFDKLTSGYGEQAFEETFRRLLHEAEKSEGNSEYHVSGEIVEAQPNAHIVQTPTDDEDLSLVMDHFADKPFDKTGQLRYSSVPVVEAQLIDDIINVIYSRTEYLRLLNNPDKHVMFEMIRDMIRPASQQVLKQQLFHKILAERAWYEKFVSPMLQGNKRQKLLDFGSHLINAHGNGTLTSEDTTEMNKELQNIAFFDRPEDEEFRSMVDKLITVFGESMNFTNVDTTTTGSPTLTSTGISSRPREIARSIATDGYVPTSTHSTVPTTEFVFTTLYVPMVTQTKSSSQVQTTGVPYSTAERHVQTTIGSSTSNDQINSSPSAPDSTTVFTMGTTHVTALVENTTMRFPQTSTQESTESNLLTTIDTLNSSSNSPNSSTVTSMTSTTVPTTVGTDPIIVNPTMKTITSEAIKTIPQTSTQNPNEPTLLTTNGVTDTSSISHGTTMKSYPTTVTPGNELSPATSTIDAMEEKEDNSTVMIANDSFETVKRESAEVESDQPLGPFDPLYISRATKSIRSTSKNSTATPEPVTAEPFVYVQEPEEKYAKPQTENKKNKKDGSSNLKLAGLPTRPPSL